MPSFTASSLCEHVTGQLKGDETTRIIGLSSLSSAKQGELACLFHPKQLKQIKRSKASCLLVDDNIADTLPVTKVHIRVASSVEAFAVLMPLFHQKSSDKRGIHPTAQLGSQVEIDETAYIGPNAVIGDDVVIGSNAYIGEQVVIHDNVVIGRDVSLDTGVIIGANPFNPLKSKGKWADGRAYGSVLIGDHVSIGANTVVDRGVHSDTLIERGVKIDNLVQIAHDVIIGKQSVVIACAAIGANTVIGDHCTIGGGASIAGHLSIVDDVCITGTSVVSRSIRKPGIYSSGTTVEQHRKWRRNVARFHRLDLMAVRLRRLERNLKVLLEREES